MIRAVALRVLVASTVGVGIAYASAFRAGGEGAPTWGVWLFIVATAALMIATMTLGAVRGDGRPSDRTLVAAFLIILAVLVVGFGMALALPADEGPGAPLWLGLPRRAAIVLYGVGVLPLFALPLVYALTFDRTTLSEADLERVRRARTDAGARR